MTQQSKRPCLTISTLAVLLFALCIFNSNAGVLLSGDGQLSICDQTKASSFSSSFQDYVNCTNFGLTPSGLSICADSPFLTGFDGNWQFPAGMDAIQGFGSGSNVNLYYCGKCETANCNNIKARDDSNPYACSTGTFTTDDFGQSWTCVNSTCHGEIIKLPNGTYICDDDACSGSSYMVVSGGGNWRCYDAACDEMTYGTGEYGGKTWLCSNYDCREGDPERVHGVWRCKDSSSCASGMKYYDSAQNRYVCDSALPPQTVVASDSKAVFYFIIAVLLIFCVLLVLYIQNLRAANGKIPNGNNMELAQKMTA